MKTSKLLIIALAAVMALALAACGGKKDSGGGSSSGGRAASASDFSYDLTADGKGIVIKQYSGKGGVVVIPEKIEDYPVVEIAGYAFYPGEYKDRPGALITSLVFPATISKIGHNAFREIEGLTSVTFLGGTTIELDSYAFSQCTNLEKLTIPDGLTLKPAPDSHGHFVVVQKLPLAMRQKLKDWGLFD